MLPESFYLQPTPLVARQLIGKNLVSTKGGERTTGRIVETEAYLGILDEASHSYRGQTTRNSVMFGEPGHIYVYFTYGMHYCVNVVTAPKGVAEAVLIRALEPMEGIDTMHARRHTTAQTNLCNGPAKLVQALGIAMIDNGQLLSESDGLWLEDDDVTLATSEGPRIGISRAKAMPLRFWATDNPYVSKTKQTKVQ